MSSVAGSLASVGSTSERSERSVAAVAHFVLPDSPYEMWVRDELVDYLHLPKDGTRVEVVGGEIVVSPGPTVDHNGMVRDIERGLFAAELTDSAFRWRSVQTTDLNLFEIGDGYIPDLIVLEADVLTEARTAKAKHLLPHQVDLVVEVTSRSNAVTDRRPDQKRAIGTWDFGETVRLPQPFGFDIITQTWDPRERVTASRVTR